MESKGGFSDDEAGLDFGVSEGRGFDHSSVIVLWSRMPFRASAGRLSLMIAGEWISLYACVASRPACLYIIPGPPCS